MKEIHKNLYIGSLEDLHANALEMSHWGVVHACKEPFHRELLGYTTQGAPKDHPEYLIARRGNILTLNLVDAADPKYIPKEIIEAALGFIEEELKKGKKVFVHCNQGHSRSAGIGMLYLKRKGLLPKDFFEAEEAFYKIYPDYAPGAGIRGYLQREFET